jgi:hypothetical protein
MTTKIDTQTEVTDLSTEDKEAVMQTCLDYVDGWYTANPKRMARAVHPDLVKRTLTRDPEQGWRLNRITTSEMMVEFTQAGGGSRVPGEERIYDITIQNGFRHIASVTALSPKYMDYIQLAKLGDRWVIVNVLWELREGIFEDRG